MTNSSDSPTHKSKIDTSPHQPNFGVTITYGDYTFQFSVDPLRKMSHVHVECVTKTGQTSTLIDRLVERSAASRGIDFHLAGMEVFAQQAVKELLAQLGEKPPV